MGADDGNERDSGKSETTSPCLAGSALELRATTRGRVRIGRSCSSKNP